MKDRPAPFCFYPTSDKARRYLTQQVVALLTAHHPKDPALDHTIADLALQSLIEEELSRITRSHP